MPKQRITADDLARKYAEIFGKAKAASAKTQTRATGDAGTPVAQPFVNPMTTAGDLIAGGESGAMDRLGIGADGDVLSVVSGVLAWSTGAGAGGRYRAYVLVSDGAGGFDFIDDGAGNPVTSLESLE